MATGTGFDAAAMAAWYARRHYYTDVGITAIYYLPHDSSGREIRLLEVNKLVARTNEPLEPLNFGVNTDLSDKHTLVVLDVTPSQWERIEAKQLALPGDWSLDGAHLVPRRRRRRA